MSVSMRDANADQKRMTFRNTSSSISLSRLAWTQIKDNPSKAIINYRRSGHHLEGLIENRV